MSSSTLNRLAKLKTEFEWTLECQKAFESLQKLLTNISVLHAPNLQIQFIIHVDASDTGAGAILLQESDTVLKPVCYFSKKCNSFQKNYATIEKEVLGLVWALDKFSVYVASVVYLVIIYTDHNPLIFLDRMQHKNQRLLRWFLALQAYNLKIRHIKGSDNVLADALSRTELPGE